MDSIKLETAATRGRCEANSVTNLHLKNIEIRHKYQFMSELVIRQRPETVKPAGGSVK